MCHTCDFGLIIDVHTYVTQAHTYNIVHTCMKMWLVGTRHTHTHKHDSIRVHMLHMAVAKLAKIPRLSEYRRATLTLAFFHILVYKTRHSVIVLAFVP